MSLQQFINELNNSLDKDKKLLSYDSIKELFFEDQFTENGSHGWRTESQHCCHRCPVVLHGKRPHGVEDCQRKAIQNHKSPMFAVKTKARAAEYQQTDQHSKRNEQVPPKGKDKRWQGVGLAEIADERTSR